MKKTAKTEFAVDDLKAIKIAGRLYINSTIVKASLLTIRCLNTSCLET